MPPPFAAHPGSWPLRIDVWGQVQAPLRMVRRLLSTTPGLAIEPSMRRSLPAALEAIGRGEIDACFGRPRDLANPRPNGLSTSSGWSAWRSLSAPATP